jgi:hypothetical protein
MERAAYFLGGCMTMAFFLSLGITTLDAEREQAIADRDLCNYIVSQRDEHILFLQEERDQELRAIGRMLLPPELIMLAEETQNEFGFTD